MATKEQELKQLENKQNKLLEKIQSLKEGLEDKKKNNPQKEEVQPVEEIEEEEEEEEEEVVEAPKQVKKEITEQGLRSENIKTLRNMLNNLARSKVSIKGGLSDSHIKEQQKKVVDRLIKKNKDKYEKYQIMGRDALNALKKKDDLIQKIIELATAPNLTDEEIESGKFEFKRPKNAGASDKSINVIKKELSDKQTTDAEKVRKVYAEFDKLIEMDKKEPSDETKARIKESGELVKQLLGNIFESKSLTKEQFNGLYGDIVVIVNDRMSKVDLSKVIVDIPVIMNDAKAFNEAMRKNIQTQEDMRKMIQQAAGERLARQGKLPQVKDPASGMEVKDPASGMEVKMAPSKLGSRQNPIVIKPEEKEEPFIPKPVVGTDYQGSKEMFEPKQKDVKIEPFGGLQSEKEINAPYISTTSDKAIGDVRQVGFIGAQDQLAKVDDVTLEPSERSKSLKRFTNFRWVQSVQNSDLGYASPFQRMDDIENRHRYSKCFMHVNKMPKDADTQDELEKAKGFNTYSLVPSFDMSSRMQPAGNLSFINSTSKFARKITGNEQGMEPINQGKRNVSNLKNTLEFPTLLYSEDPLKKIKDKYKNNIVC